VISTPLSLMFGPTVSLLPPSCSVLAGMEENDEPELASEANGLAMPDGGLDAVDGECGGLDAAAPDPA